ncbi:response regulator transcription factor [Kiritimatiellota bacterium B12222]|nr:response regulator transcription factor [Kiritimatiellota bacterium B12222]
MNKILVVEDDQGVGESLLEGLTQEGYQVVWARSGEEAMEAVNKSTPSLVVLDLGLPDEDGFSVMAKMQAIEYSIPILILSARSEVETKVRGLKSGAVDYLVKPFAFPELLARIHLRLNGAPELVSGYGCGTLVANVLKREIFLDGELLELPPREYDFLICLLRAHGKTVSREEIARDVWKSPKRMSSLDNLIDVHVSRLREHLHGDGAPLLRTLRGVGYRLEEPV